MTDLISRLRDTPNWMRESYGSWKDCVLKYDRAPFEAADEIERLRADAERWQTLYRRAINEANGLTDYVEDRPELRRAERNIAAIEAAARAALKETP